MDGVFLHGTPGYLGQINSHNIHLWEHTDLLHNNNNNNNNNNFYSIIVHLLCFILRLLY